MKPIAFYLGLCIGYIPGNLPLSNDLCFMEAEAKQREISVTQLIDDFEREYFKWEVAQVVWPKN